MSSDAASRPNLQAEASKNASAFTPQRDVTPSPTREWANTVLQNTPMYKSVNALSLADIGARSFAAYKEKKKQRWGCSSLLLSLPQLPTY